MSDTIRERIISNLAARLSVITVANGYNTDIGGNVLRAKVTLGKDEPPAAVAFPETEESLRKYGKQHCVMPVRVEGTTYYGTDNPSVVAERILGDVIRCICGGTLVEVTGGLADDVEYTGGGTDEYPDAGEKLIGASAVFNIKYKTLAGDPYNQS